VTNRSPDDKSVVLQVLADGCSATSLEVLDASQVALLSEVIRCCICCLAFGRYFEPLQTAPLSGADRQTAPWDIYGCLIAAYRDATVAAAADLDPLSVGPSHLALPATVATSIAAAYASVTDDEKISTAILAGIETASRLRLAIRGGRVGVGFHSSGTFGTIAAAASVSRLMGLDTRRTTEALAIALTRMSGLSINSGSKRICITHFGWAAAHGLEAAWLASEDWSASHDVKSAIGSFFPQCTFDTRYLRPEASTMIFGPTSTVSKNYPCNIFLNPLVAELADTGDAISALRIRIPSIRHLNHPDPADTRELRYSAQGVAAVALTGDISYRSFSDAALKARNMQRPIDSTRIIEVLLDPSISTDFDLAYVAVGRSSRDGRQQPESSRTLRSLSPWSQDRAFSLAGHDSDLITWIKQLYSLSYSDAYDFARNLTPAAGLSQ
jgi:hypothetical protein